jgi:hypothetical protein
MVPWIMGYPEVMLRNKLFNYAGQKSSSGKPAVDQLMWPGTLGLVPINALVLIEFGANFPGWSANRKLSRKG